MLQKIIALGTINITVIVCFYFYDCCVLNKESVSKKFRTVIFIIIIHKQIPTIQHCYSILIYLTP